MLVTYSVEVALIVVFKKPISYNFKINKKEILSVPMYTEMYIDKKNLQLKQLCQPNPKCSDNYAIIRTITSKTANTCQKTLYKICLVQHSYLYVIVNTSIQDTAPQKKKILVGEHKFSQQNSNKIKKYYQKCTMIHNDQKETLGSFQSPTECVYKQQSMAPQKQINNKKQVRQASSQ